MKCRCVLNDLLTILYMQELRRETIIQGLWHLAWYGLANKIGTYSFSLSLIFFPFSLLSFLWGKFSCHAILVATCFWISRNVSLVLPSLSPPLSFLIQICIIKQIKLLLGTMVLINGFGLTNFCLYLFKPWFMQHSLFIPIACLLYISSSYKSCVPSHACMHIQNQNLPHNTFLLLGVWMEQNVAIIVYQQIYSKAPWVTKMSP